MSTAILYDAAGGIVERVKFSEVVEPYLTDATQPVALVNCYLHNGVGGTSNALVAQALQNINGYYTAAGLGIPGYKAAGVKVTATQAPEQPIPVTGTIETNDTVLEATCVAAAETAIQAYLLGLPLGITCEVAEIYVLVMGVPGVTNWLPQTPLADVPATQPWYKIMPGAISVIPG